MQQKSPDSQSLTDAQIEEMREAYEADGKHEILKVLHKLRQERVEKRRDVAARNSLNSPAEEPSALEPPVRSHRELRGGSD